MTPSCIRLGPADEPHLVLSETFLALAGKFIIGMDLYGKILCGVNPLEKQGKLQTVFPIDFLTHQIAHIHFDQIDKRIALQKAVGHHRFIPVHTRKHPGFAAVG